MRKIFIFALVFLFLVSSTYAANLLANPGFETGADQQKPPPSWNGDWTPTSAGGQISISAAHSGSKGLWIYTGKVTSKSWASVYQEFSTSAGAEISASAYIRVPPNSQWVDWTTGSFASLRIEFFDSSGNSLLEEESERVTSWDSTWKQKTISVTVPSNTAKVRIFPYLEKPATGSASISVANFDDVSLEITDAPEIAELYLDRKVVGIGEDITQKSLTIKNVGTSTLSYSLSESYPWMSLSRSSGSLSPGMSHTINVIGNRGSCNEDTCFGSIIVDTNVEDDTIRVFLEDTTPSYADGPSFVEIDGKDLMVQRRLLDGSLSQPAPYLIRGVAWTPASIGTSNDLTQRRNEYKNWYVEDVQLLKEMGVNTVYVFLDFFANSDALDILDYLYHNGIMVIMTVDSGNNNLATIDSIVPYYKNHPAILMWAIGNEWNINYYHGKYTTLDQSALATESAAQRIKSYDATHPVASIYGEINISDNGQPLSKTQEIVNEICPSVDIWGLNIYRGRSFGNLFSTWDSITDKPMFLSEYGTDSYINTNPSDFPVTGYEDGVSQASFIGDQWEEIETNFYLDRTLGGTVFESSDEWWKVSEAGSSILTHDNGGFSSKEWDANAHPDGFANEEYFGIMHIEREPKEAYNTLQSAFFQSYSQELSSGWQLLSIPVIPLNLSIASVFSGVEYEYLLGFTNGSYYIVDETDELTPGQGFLIYVQSPQTIVVNGTALDHFSPSLEWALFSAPYLKPSSLYGNISVFTFDGAYTWSSYLSQKTTNNLSSLEPGNAYFMRTE